MTKLKGNISAKGKGLDNNPENINKEGAPKGKRVSTIIKELLNGNLKDFLPDTELNINGNKGLAIELIAMAFGKDKDKLSAIKEVLDRIEGKAIQTNVIETKEKLEGITFDKE